MNTMENYQYENKVTGYGGIAKKLVLIMGECSHVAKDGFNDFHKGQGHDRIGRGLRA